MKRTNKREKLEYLRGIEKKVREKLKHGDHGEEVQGEKFFITFSHPKRTFLASDSVVLSKVDFLKRYQEMNGKKVIVHYGVDCRKEHFRNRMDFQGKEEEEIDTSAISEEVKKCLHMFGCLPSSTSKYSQRNHILFTTRENEYFKKFIIWQMSILKKLGLLTIGRRSVVYCPTMKRRSKNYDRSVGEGYESAEFTMLKMKLIGNFELKLILGEQELGKYSDRSVFLAIPTTKPETLFGLSNIWVNPRIGDYGCYETKSGDLLIMNEYSARNLSYQYHLSSSFGECESICPLFKGECLIGCEVEFPFPESWKFEAKRESFYVLPNPNIRMDRRSGIHISTPSVSPKDYQLWRRFRKDPEYQDKILETISTIMTSPPEIGKNLFTEEISEVEYRKGVMYDVGPRFSGKNVVEVRDVIKKELVEKSGLAIKYYEPQERVVSRDGTVCYSASLKQWVVRYSDEDWKKRVEENIINMKWSDSSSSSHSVNEILQSVSIKWDYCIPVVSGMEFPKTVEEVDFFSCRECNALKSLYQIVSHYFHADEFGRVPGLLGLKPEEVGNEIFDYIFLGGGKGDPEEEEEGEEGDNGHNNILTTKYPKIRDARNEFCRVFPIDYYVTSRGQLDEFVTMIFHLEMLFSQKKLRYRHEKKKNYLPKKVFVSGIVKERYFRFRRRSDEIGLRQPLIQAIENFGADALRLALSDCGDTMEDVKLDLNEVEISPVHQLSKIVYWCEDMKYKMDHVEKYLRTKKSSKSDLHRGSEIDFCDTLFEAKMKKSINQVLRSYRKMRFRDVLKHGFHELMGAMTKYSFFLKNNDSNLRVDLVQKFIDIISVLMTPIIPHICEHLSSGRRKKQIMLKDCDLLSRQDIGVIQIDDYYSSNLSKFRRKIDFPPRYDDGVVIFVCRELEDWQMNVLDLLKTMFVENGEKDILKILNDTRTFHSRLMKKKEEQEVEVRNNNYEVGKMMRFFASKKREILKEMEETEVKNENWVNRFLNVHEVPEISVLRRSRSRFFPDDEYSFWNQEFVKNRLMKEFGVFEVIVRYKKEFFTEDEILDHKRFANSCLPNHPQISLVVNNHGNK